MTAKRAVDLAIAAMTTKLQWYISRPRSQVSRKRAANERDTKDALSVLLELRRSLS